MPAAAEPQVVRIGPNPGPQSQAYSSTADVTVYGGAAMGGKTWLALLRMGVHADRYPGYYGCIFRREMPMITVGGGLWEESMKLYPIWGSEPNITMRQWRWPKSNSLIQMRSLQHETDVLNYQGAQLAEFCLEEGTHYPESMFWYMFSRLRTTCGMKARAIVTCNPDPDSWLRRLIDWYIGHDGFPLRDRAGVKRYFVRDGDAMVWGSTPDEVRALAPHITADPHNQPKSLRFIPAKIDDNPRGDPTYRGRLNALPLVERERLLGGNWNIKHAAGTMFKRHWFKVIEMAPPDAVQTVRFWDLAATEPSTGSPDPDWTRGVKMSRTPSGRFVVSDVASLRGRPHEVEALIKRTAEVDGRRVTVGFWQDPGAAGKSEAERYRTMLAGWDVRIIRASSDKVTFAKPASSQAEGGNIELVRGPWNDVFLSEHESFPDGRHDDIVDAESGAMQVLTTDTPVRFTTVKGI